VLAAARGGRQLPRPAQLKITASAAPGDATSGRRWTSCAARRLPPGPREASTDSFRNHRTLELGNHAHHLKHRFPAGVMVSTPCWRRNRSILSACSSDRKPTRSCGVPQSPPHSRNESVRLWRLLEGPVSASLPNNLELTPARCSGSAALSSRTRLRCEAGKR
jgi:hypothetical protein